MSHFSSSVAGTVLVPGVMVGRDESITAAV